MDLHAVPVELELMDPARGFSIDVASAGSMKAREVRLDANRRFSH
jgi:hypothetical protein